MQDVADRPPLHEASVHHRRGQQDREPTEPPLVPRLRRAQYGLEDLPTFKQFRRDLRTDAIAVPLAASAGEPGIGNSNYRTRPRRGLLLSEVLENDGEAPVVAPSRRTYVYSRPYQDAEEKAESAQDDAEVAMGDATGKQLLILKIGGDDAFSLGIATVREKTARDRRSATGRLVLEETRPAERATPEQVATMLATVSRRKVGGGGTATPVPRHGRRVSSWQSSVPNP